MRAFFTDDSPQGVTDVDDGTAPAFLIIKVQINSDACHHRGYI